MTCQNPKWIYLPKALPIRNAEFEENQKKLRKPLWHYAKNRYAIQIPCGECVGCLLDRASEHATKCYCEMQTAKEGCFITLTYNNGFRQIKGQEEDLSLPLTDKGKEIYDKLIKDYPLNHVMKCLAKAQEHGLDIMDLRIRDLQNFIKRLRKKLDKNNIKIRYLACGERGEDKKRVHFHATIFSWKPTDLKTYRQNHQGDWLYTSEELQSIWGCGFVTIGELNFKTASYTARYVQKKAYTQHKKRKYNLEYFYRHSMEECCNILNEYHTYYDKRKLSKNDYIAYFMKVNSIKRIIKDKIIPEEFITMSNRPGIGLNWFLQNIDKVKKSGGILIHLDSKNTSLKKCPKYFKKKWKELNWEEFYNWNYQQQLKAQKSYQNEINKLNYPDNWEEWRKEQEFINYRNRLFNNKIRNLYRINLEQQEIN